MNIKDLHKAISDMKAAGIPEEQAWLQVEATKDLIIETIEPSINRLKLEMTIRLGSIMAGGLILFTAVISVLILKH
jgi:hypothetical protein